MWYLRLMPLSLVWGGQGRLPEAVALELRPREGHEAGLLGCPLRESAGGGNGCAVLSRSGLGHQLLPHGR